MPRFTRNDAQAILDSVLKAGSENIESVELTLDSVNDFTDKLNATKVAGEQSAGMSAIYQAVLDGALDYQRSHGALPDASVIAAALNQADVVMDDVVSASGDSKGHSVNAFTPMEPIIAIRSMIATTIPFAFNIMRLTVKMIMVFKKYRFQTCFIHLPRAMCPIFLRHNIKQQQNC
ncbi:MAG: hypothetical protein SPE06_08385 [[Actinobacillus] rossii]|nr:hypothetical protein [[Actinobacillus] rossii]MDY4506385.1 hypothetical protein [[Actinobacillus] rossii]